MATVWKMRGLFDLKCAVAQMTEVRMVNIEQPLEF